MENNPNILEFMQAEVQFFQELISEISGEQVVMVEVDASKPKSKSTKDFKPVKSSARYDKEKKILIITSHLTQIISTNIINKIMY